MRFCIQVPSILASGWCVRMEWIVEYLLQVKVIWRHAHKSIPWTLLGLYFKRSDEHTQNFYLGVPPPHATIPGMKIQTYLIKFTLWGKLFQFLMTDSPQSDPFLSVHCLIGFRLFWNYLGRGFSLCFFLLLDYGNQ